MIEKYRINNLFDKVKIAEIAVGSKNEAGRITAGLKITSHHR